MFPRVLHIRNTHSGQAAQKQQNPSTFTESIQIFDSSAGKRGKNLADILSLSSLVATSQTRAAVGGELVRFPSLTPLCAPLYSHCCLKKIHACWGSWASAKQTQHLTGQINHSIAMKQSAYLLEERAAFHDVQVCMSSAVSFP